MKRRAITIIALICIICMITHCWSKRKVYNFTTELGDRLELEVYMGGNIDGIWPCYNLYDGNGDKIGNAIYGDRTTDRFPDNPLDKIVVVGKYGNTCFYKLFDLLVFYQNGVRMGDLPRNPSPEDYRIKVEAHPTDPDWFKSPVSDLIGSGVFEYIYTYGVMLVYEDDTEMKSLLERYAASDFTDEETKVNRNSSIAECDMMEWAKELLETYYSG